MIREKTQRTEPIIIDLTGPDGNAFVLMGMAKRFGRQLDWDSAKTADVISEMMSGDYENLIQVSDREFGNFVILER